MNIDYMAHSPTETTFRQAEHIRKLEERNESLTELQLKQAGRLVEMQAANYLLVNHADAEMGGRYGRLEDAMSSIEHLAWESGRRGVSVDSGLLIELLRDANVYAESGRCSDLLCWCMEDAERFARQDKPQ